MLAACDGPDTAGAPQAADPDNLIECAVGGAAAFTRECVVERSPGDLGLILTVRHPDGGFRRFEVTDDGTGVATADGAQAAQVAMREGGIEVAVGTDRYRFPATIGDDDRR
jgi:hypothetical protein